MHEHKIFASIEMKKITTQNAEEVLAETGIKILFLWGYNCPNCEVAKNSILENLAEYKSLNLKWYHADLYEDFELAHQFGVHGVPVFFVYRDQTLLGRVTGYPGHEAFFGALRQALVDR